MVGRGAQEAAPQRVRLLFRLGPGDGGERAGLAGEPGSGGFEPLRQVHVPGAVASTRTRNVCPPSQKP